MTGAPLRPSVVRIKCDELAFVGRMAGLDGNELGEEVGFVDVQAAAVGVGESPWSDLGRAAVVDDAGSPGRFDPLARGRDAAARLAGDDDLVDWQCGQVDVDSRRRLRRVAARRSACTANVVTLAWRINSMRARLPSPPPGITSEPRAVSASNALQNPMNGPNENASSTRSLGVTRAASSTYCQASIHHCQSSAVSRTTSGRPRVPEV